MEKVQGFSEIQRQWFLLRDGQCQFHYVLNGKWVRCPIKAKLQIHHVIPRGWANMHYPKDFPLNGASNGIALCEHHHIGKGSVHPDTYEAWCAYHMGNKNAYHEMMEKRYELNSKGIPYWDTQWDFMFARIIQKLNVSFLRTHPYPHSGKYGNTGRAK